LRFGSRGGSKTNSKKGLEVNSKIKTKKFQKRLFLDLAFELKNILIFLKKTIQKLQK
jgi:hypothetical protein